MLTEGLVLAVAGGLGGVAAGLFGLLAMSADQIPGTPEASLNLIVLAFTFGLVILTGLVFGTVPALAVTRGNASAHLKDDSTRGTAGKRPGAMRMVLLAIFGAIALVLSAIGIYGVLAFGVGSACASSASARRSAPTGRPSCRSSSNRG